MKLHLLAISFLTQGILALPPLTATSEDPTRNPPKNCGGHTPEPNPCPQGQICAPTQPKGSADFPGTCVFQPCGGKPNNGICPLGLVCVYSSTDKRTDQPGRCFSTKLTCGDKGAKCPSGWKCLKEPKIDFEYWEEFKAVGICVPPEF